MFGSKTLFVKVEGMHCQHCAMNVTKALSSLEGVKSVSVDLAKKIATVKYKGELNEADIQKAIEDIGFTYAGKAEA